MQYTASRPSAWAASAPHARISRGGRGSADRPSHTYISLILLSDKVARDERLRHVTLLLMELVRPALGDPHTHITHHLPPAIALGSILRVVLTRCKVGVLTASGASTAFCLVPPCLKCWRVTTELLVRMPEVLDDIIRVVPEVGVRLPECRRDEHDDLQQVARIEISRDKGITHQVLQREGNQVGETHLLADHDAQVFDCEVLQPGAMETMTRRDQMGRERRFPRSTPSRSWRLLCLSSSVTVIVPSLMEEPGRMHGASPVA